MVDGLIDEAEERSIQHLRREALTVRSVGGHSFLVGAKEILPEDLLWRTDHPRTPALICLQDDKACMCTWGCVPKLAFRCFWLFGKNPKLQQLFILFSREEKPLKRVVQLGAGDEAVQMMPRVFVMHVPRDFDSSPYPYRLFRANYSGLRMVLEGAAEKIIETPTDFWLSSAGG